MKEMSGKNLERTQQGDAEITREGPVFVPEIDIYEKDDAILVRCDMPGVTQDELDILFENSELTITGHQITAQPEGVDLLSGEYNTGSFQRKFKVAQLVDHEKINARLYNGVLDIELPKAEQAKPRKIEITTGA